MLISIIIGGICGQLCRAVDIDEMHLLILHECIKATDQRALQCLSTADPGMQMLQCFACLREGQHGFEQGRHKDDTRDPVPAECFNEGRGINLQGLGIKGQRYAFEDRAKDFPYMIYKGDGGLGTAYLTLGKGIL